MTKEKFTLCAATDKIAKLLQVFTNLAILNGHLHNFLTWETTILILFVFLIWGCCFFFAPKKSATFHNFFIFGIRAKFKIFRGVSNNNGWNDYARKISISNFSSTFAWMHSFFCSVLSVFIDSPFWQGLFLNRHSGFTNYSIK